MGLVLGASTPTKVLIRGIGPTLGAFGVPGTVADPQLTLFNSTSAKIGEKSDWGGTAEPTAAFASVGASSAPAPAGCGMPAPRGGCGGGCAHSH